MSEQYIHLPHQQYREYLTKYVNGLAEYLLADEIECFTRDFMKKAPKMKPMSHEIQNELICHRFKMTLSGRERILREIARVDIILDGDLRASVKTLIDELQRSRSSRH